MECAPTRAMLAPFVSIKLVFGLLLAQAFAPVTPPPEASPVASPLPPPGSSQTLLPARTPVKVHVVSMLSSHDAQTGEKFTFVVDEDVLSGGLVVIPRCTEGTGTITLAGKHGINGHEGDLHLRFDALTPDDAPAIPLDKTELQFEGKQRKSLAFFTTRWINGDDVEVPPSQVLTVTLAGDTALAAPSHAAPVCPAIAPTSAPATSPE